MAPEKGRDLFDIIEKRLVRIEVDGSVWIKRGSLIAYNGQLKFRREKVLHAEHLKIKSGPLRSAIKREIVPLARAEGKGVLYISDSAKHSQVIRLKDGCIYVVAETLLAFEPSVSHEVQFVGGVGLLAGGILVVKLSGTGLVAVGLKGDPLTLPVTTGNAVYTDPTAVVAWGAPLWPTLKTDLAMKTIIGHGGGEPVQMRFEGDGYVVVHARSEMEDVKSSLFKKAKSTLKKLLPF
jgi:uncharacterized protein (AIM24 family)